MGRQEAVLGPAGEDDKDFNNALANGKAAVSGAVGITVGAGVTFIASPVGGALAGGGASAVTGMVIEYVGQQFEPDALESASDQSGSIWQADRNRTGDLAQETARVATDRHLPHQSDSAPDWASVGVERGFSSARTNVAGMADDLTTEITP